MSVVDSRYGYFHLALFIISAAHCAADQESRRIVSSLESSGDAAPSAVRDDQDADARVRHVISISRVSEDDDDAAYIEEAERLCPDQMAVRRAFSMFSAQQLPGPEEDCLWWQGEAFGIRIPFAVTQRAIEYYTEIVELIRQGHPQVPYGPIEESRLNYRAAVSRHDIFVQGGRTFSEVTVARLELSWTHFGQDLNAFGFTLIRVVVFHADEEPVILGDGEVAIWGV